MVRSPHLQTLPVIVAGDGTLDLQGYSKSFRTLSENTKLCAHADYGTTLLEILSAVLERRGPIDD
jgi:hypothetical protein